ncbi:MAG: hypothetical protein AAF738_10330 [Bacteroidota bacterium]
MNLKNTYITISLLFFSLMLMAQVRPDQFPVDLTPSDTDALYTQEGGSPRKFTLDVLKAYFASDAGDIVTSQALIIDGVTYPAGASIETILPALAFDSDTTALVQDSILVNYRYGIEQSRDTIRVNSSSSTASSLFNSSRAILRIPQVGDNIGGSTVQDFLEYWYFSPPTMSLAQSPSTSTYEIGTSTLLTYTTSVSNSGGAALTNGKLRNTTSGVDISSFGATTNDVSNITFTPQQGGSGDYNELTYSFQSSQDWSSGSESGLITSTTRTIRGVYPVLYGMASTDTATVLANLYTTLSNKVVSQENNLTVSYTGSGLIYYAFPQTWSDTNLDQILDPNGFNVLPSFTRVTYSVVTSSGLTNDYTNAPYVVYFLNTGSTTTSASQYQFIR